MTTLNVVHGPTLKKLTKSSDRLLDDVDVVIMSPVTGMHHALGSCETFQPSYRDEKRSKILGTRSGAKFGKKSKHGETKILTYWPIIARVTLKAESLQLHGMLMIWKILQAMQDDAIRNARIHPAVHPGNRGEVFIW